MIRDSSKKVVKSYERLLDKFIKDCKLAKSNLPSDEAVKAQRTIEMVLVYLDSVGLVVLKLYEIVKKLLKKTMNPFSYTFYDYKSDMKQFKKLYETFQQKRKALNILFYGR